MVYSDGFVLNAVDVVLVGILMILIARAHRNRLSRTVLRHKLLQGIRKPNIEEWDAWHDREPVGSIVHVACAIVSVEGKHPTDEDTPLKSLIGWVEPEESLKLESIVFPRLLILIIVKEVFFGLWFHLTHVGSPKFVHLRNLINVLLGTSIEVLR